MKYFNVLFNRKRKSTLNLFKENSLNTNSLMIKENNELWQDCGDIFYLLETLKLTFETDEGLITMEKLSHDSLNCLMKGKLPPSSKLRTSDCITLSVCAVSLQNLANKKRTKAIADAAFLRIFEGSKLQSQAQFQHSELPLDNKVNSLTRYSFKRGINTIYGLSLQKFINTLVKKNSLYIKKFGNNSPVCSDNFERNFTNHELEKLSSVSNY